VCWHCDMAVKLEDKAVAEEDEAESDALLLMAREQYERCECT
jgi:hypothetical protein